MQKIVRKTVINFKFLVNGYYTFADASEICATLPTKYTNYGRRYGQLAQADNIFEWLFLTAMALENDYDELFMGIRFQKSVGYGIESS